MSTSSTPISQYLDATAAVAGGQSHRIDLMSRRWWALSPKEQIEARRIAEARGLLAPFTRNAENSRRGVAA